MLTQRDTALTHFIEGSNPAADVLRDLVLLRDSDEFTGAQTTGPATATTRM